MKRNVCIGAILGTLFILMNLSFSNQKVLILHRTGNGNYQLLSVSANALSGHAQHDDVYASTYCPVSGPENACR
jgi:hypothetical protein